MPPSDLPLVKACSRCGEIKPADAFGKNSRLRSGLTSQCKACCAEYQRERRAEDPEANRRYAREWRAKNPDKVRALKRRYNESHKEQIAEAGRRRRAQKPDEIRAKNQRYRESNREKVRAKHSEWRAKNPEKWSDYRDRRRAQMRGSAVGPIDFDALWTGLCGICGETMDAALRRPDLMSKSVDHIIPLAKGGPHTQENVQWAHLICNLRKRDDLPVSATI